MTAISTPYNRAGVGAGESTSSGGGRVSGNKILIKSQSHTGAAFHKMHSAESPQSQSRSEVVETQIISSDNKTWNTNINSNNNSIHSKKASKQQQIFSFSQQNTQSDSVYQIQMSGYSHDSHSSEDSPNKSTIPSIISQNSASNSNTSGVSFDAITEEPNSSCTIYSTGTFNGVFPNNTQSGSGSGSSKHKNLRLNEDVVMYLYI